MGQVSCQLKEEQFNSQYLNKQIAIYKWRADPICNYYISRVTFKDIKTHQHQQLFEEYLNINNQVNISDCSRLLKTEKNQTAAKQRQIVYFQQYLSNLSSLNQPIQFQQSIYLIVSIIQGYKQLRKVFSHIPVSLSHCFKYHDGTIRVWINQNVKFNKPQKNIPLYNIQSDIMHELLKMIQQITEKDNRTFQFFTYIMNQLNEQMYTFQNIKNITLKHAINIHLVIPWKLNVSKYRPKTKRNNSTVEQSYISKNQTRQQSLFKNQMKTSIMKKNPTIQFKKPNNSQKKVNILFQDKNSNNISNQDEVATEFQPKIQIKIVPSNKSFQKNIFMKKNQLQINSHIVQPVYMQKQNISQPRSQKKYNPNQKNNNLRVKMGDMNCKSQMKLKTITKLISSNQIPLQHSIGQSSSQSSHLIGSVYSGVLSKMGRQATIKRINTSICDNP